MVSFFIWIVLVSLIEYIGDSSLKSYTRFNDKIGLVIGIMAYIGVVIGLIILLKKTNVMYFNGMWDGVSAVFC